MKINLYVPQEVKRILFKIATEQRKSISAVVTDMAYAAKVTLLAIA